MLADFVRAARKGETGDARFVLHGAIAVMIAVCSAGWYEHNLGDGEILTLFCAVCGCGYVARGVISSQSSVFSTGAPAKSLTTEN
jgi:hypothetical protein